MKWSVVSEQQMSLPGLWFNVVMIKEKKGAAARAIYLDKTERALKELGGLDSTIADGIWGQVRVGVAMHAEITLTLHS